MSRLAGWLLNTIGKSDGLVASRRIHRRDHRLGVRRVHALFLTGIAAPLTFAIVLYNAAPPLPDE